MEKVNSKLNRQAPNQVSINNFTYKEWLSGNSRD